MAEQEVATPVLDLLTNMTEASIEASSLDAETLMLVRIAALVAVDGAPASYLLNLGAAGETGVDGDQIEGVLTAIAPIVGTARIVSAAGKIVQALGIAVGLAELEEQAEEDEKSAG
jgi:alkylhydroperoxidase/carboxymuconolactone decarboxylase family protein YurZ